MYDSLSLPQVFLLARNKTIMTSQLGLEITTLHITLLSMAQMEGVKGKRRMNTALFVRLPPTREDYHRH